MRTSTSPAPGSATSSARSAPRPGASTQNAVADVTTPRSAIEPRGMRNSCHEWYPYGGNEAHSAKGSSRSALVGRRRCRRPHRPRRHRRAFDLRLDRRTPLPWRVERTAHQGVASTRRDAVRAGEHRHRGTFDPRRTGHRPRGDLADGSRSRCRCSGSSAPTERYAVLSRRGSRRPGLPPAASRARRRTRATAPSCGDRRG